MASIARRALVGGGGGGQAPSPKGRAIARGLDARLRLQHPFMRAEDAFTRKSDQNSLDGDHGIYRLRAGQPAWRRRHRFKEGRWHLSIRSMSGQGQQSRAGGFLPGVCRWAAWAWEAAPYCNLAPHEDVRRWFILVVAVLLDPAAVPLLLTPSAVSAAFHRQHRAVAQRVQFGGGAGKFSNFVCF
jgi:hypothetical protein